MTRMNPEVKAKWLTALRSGMFGQTRSKLSDGEGNYCCLGVLCEVALRDESKPERLVKDCTGQRYGDMGTDSSRAYLPRMVQEWAGLIDDSGYFKNDNGDFNDNGVEIVREDGTIILGNSLASLNDDKATFEEIANVIEEYF